ncbi:MAG TPA: iron ABC transporter permease [Candidatus Bipolaricaulota bacterium]
MHSGAARWMFLALALLVLLGLGAGVAIGPVMIPLDQLVDILFKGWGAEDKPAFAQIVHGLRVPRALTAALVGWALAVSGAVMQGVFQNPLASPYVLGIASGASAGAALVIALGLQGSLGGFALAIGAFVGGAVVVWVVQHLARLRSGPVRTDTLILAGVALGALFSAVTTLLIFLSGEQLKAIVLWIMGGLGRSSWSYLTWLAPVIVAGTALLLPYGRQMNALALGDGVRHLGVDSKRLHRALLGVVTLMTASAVAVAGTIGFVGLIVPHALRLLMGPDHRLLLPACALGGAAFLMTCDTLARTAWAPLELPVGVLTAMVGAPFFLLLLLRRQGRGGL